MSRPDPISVVLCTYNGAAFVERQLRSIIAQDEPPAEIIVSDDGSTDETLDIVATIARSAPMPIRIIVNERTLGYADNFLRACEAATHDLVALSDQDDEWLPQKLAVQRAALRRSDAVLCTHDVLQMNARGEALDVRRHRWADRARIIKPNRASPWGNFKGFTLLFDRSLLSYLPADERGGDTHSLGSTMPHDRWIYFLATTFGTTVVLSQPLATYRQHEAQLYGGTEARTLGERTRTKIADGRAQSSALARIAAERADLLARHRPPGSHPHWHKARERWLRLHRNLLDSRRIYDDDGVVRRVRTLLGNIRRGVYLPFRFGGLGIERLTEDAVVLVALSLPRRRAART